MFCARTPDSEEVQSREGTKYSTYCTYLGRYVPNLEMKYTLAEVSNPDIYICPARGETSREAKTNAQTKGILLLPILSPSHTGLSFPEAWVFTEKGYRSSHTASCKV